MDVYYYSGKQGEKVTYLSASRCWMLNAKRWLKKNSGHPARMCVLYSTCERGEMSQRGARYSKPDWPRTRDLFKVELSALSLSLFESLLFSVRQEDEGLFYIPCISQRYMYMYKMMFNVKRKGDAMSVDIGELQMSLDKQKNRRERKWNGEVMW